ncbi:hypothetical protein ACPWSR_09370 [Alloiococcus sp. CFN-8]|uniref:hypothetical protein n=1 Tax=Alloiococcus sp. CFN-8 TaxID=3416081 RepID=UPI003CF6C814
MEAIKRQIRFQLADGKNAFMIFWIILLAVNTLFYVVNASSKHSSIGMSFTTTFNGSQIQYQSVASVHIISIIIFIIVYSMVMYYESFPMAISFSATRKDFYIGAVIHNILLCLSMAVIQGVLMKLDGFIIEAIGRNPLYEQFIFNTKENNLLFIISVLFIIFLFTAAVFNLLGAALYRLTWKLWILIGGVLMAILNIDSLFRAVDKFFYYIGGHMSPDNSLINWAIMMILISMVFYLLAFLFIRKLSIRSKG